MHLGREHVIGCWQVGDALVDPGPSSCLPTLLEALGDDPPRALLLTHVHLDHAGAAGSLVRRWPELEVYVHERGARHMIDPARLVSSASQLYGADMGRLWGEVLPVAERNLRVLKGGERIRGGTFEVAYTPGHASHHVCYLGDGTAFVGDVGGVQISPSSMIIPPTPPPDIDVEAWHRSIELIGSWRPRRLARTHFGAGDDVAGELAELDRRLDEWSELAHARGREAFIATVREQIRHGVGAERAQTYQQATPVEQTYAGFERYWSKRTAD